MPARTIIVTGASRRVLTGIGLSATGYLLQDGAHVVAVQRSMTSELTTLAEKYPNALRIIQGDVTDDAIIQRTVKESLETFRSIDGVVFNAGAMPDIAPVAQLGIDDWLRTFDVNFFGVIRLLRAVLPALTSGARIVFISSASSSVLALPAAGPYSASKAALDSLNRRVHLPTLAAEHPDKVCIAYLPGPVKTKMRDEFIAALKPFLSPEMAKHYDSFQEIQPKVPGRNIATLALRAPIELSGKCVRWDDPALLRNL
ncbi:NAD(P)-binding protein [Auricularia subglabra TFB-10046 SS5]|nr:NAD(P)-binding protein [Auricularia subglabra TFB-10046 SS5]